MHNYYRIALLYDRWSYFSYIHGSFSLISIKQESTHQPKLQLPGLQIFDGEEYIGRQSYFLELSGIIYLNIVNHINIAPDLYRIETSVHVVPRFREGILYATWIVWFSTTLRDSCSPYAIFLRRLLFCTGRETCSKLEFQYWTGEELLTYYHLVSHIHPFL